MRIIRNIIYAFKGAFTSIRVNRGLTAITVGTIGISITLFGIFFLIFINLQKAATDIGKKIKLVVYLEDNISLPQLESIKKNIASYSEIERFIYVSKEDALSNFRNRLMDKKTILDGLGSNPLPASFVIEIKENFRTLDNLDSIARRFSAMEGIEEVEYGKEWIDRFETIMAFLKLGMTSVGGILAVGLIFIISNTIRLSIHSRIDEIEIMKLVGATNRFISGPFIIEGIIQGFLGAIISIILLTGIYKIFMNRLSYSVMLIFGLSEISFIQYRVMIEICISGISLGFIGSLVSLGKILKAKI